MTECKQKSFGFHQLGRRQVIAQTDGGNITSDGGILLLREVEKRIGVLERFSGCFIDRRDSRWVEHRVEQMVAQRVYGICLGYEDLNDHDRLRWDPMLALAAEREDLEGRGRRRAGDEGKALAGKSTLNRLELTKAEGGDRYKKIVMDEGAVDRLMVDVFIESHQEAPTELILDLDVTDDLIHGHQEGRFFHGYYGNYCYLPLYIFSGEHLLCARLRVSNQDASEGCMDELERIVGRIREAWPGVGIVIRADSGFCREAILSWCENHGVDYVIGIARNARLEAELAEELDQARQQYEREGKPVRIFKEFFYETVRGSWSRKRRVIGKAEHMERGPNPRFVVTSFAATRVSAQPLYENVYCARGDMENRIKEQQLDLFADRTSTGTMRANQLRLYFSSMAYILMHGLRRLGLKDTELARAQCGSIRLKLLKIGARIRISVRRIWISLATGYPYAGLFAQIYNRLQMIPLKT
jgi:Transposase DDE domain group 1